MAFTAASLLTLFLVGSSATAATKNITHKSYPTHFVTRLEVKVPTWDITVYDESRITPGYWFLSPYYSLTPSYPGDEPEVAEEDCEIGAVIYDSAGELVWTSSCKYRNRNTFDFKVQKVDGEDVLTFLTAVGPRYHIKGVGVILDDRYEERNAVEVQMAGDETNIHDFLLVDDGQTAIVWYWLTRNASGDAIGLQDQTVVIHSTGFWEIHVETGEKLFQWDPLDHIPLNESSYAWPIDNPIISSAPGWDYLHGNSVEKFPDGDYLVSARYTNSLFKISRKDGHVVWRLGGKLSDFELLGNLNFSRQHDARIRSHNDTHTIITLLDNAATPNPDDVGNETAAWSLVLFVLVDHEAKTAALVKPYDRPDHKYSTARGNVQLLDNGNVFVGWSDQGYITEFDEDGDLLFEAVFGENDREIKTYRAFKFDWAGHPTEAPAVKCLAKLEEPGIATSCYVSWNGDTEVSKWVFYGKAEEDGRFKKLGEADRAGFETNLETRSFPMFVFAEALDRQGTRIGMSEEVEVVDPPGMDSLEQLPKHHVTPGGGRLTAMDESLSLMVLVFAVILALGTAGGFLYFFIGMRKQAGYMAIADVGLDD